MPFSRSARLVNWWLILPWWLRIAVCGTFALVTWHVAGGVPPRLGPRLVDISGLETLCLLTAGMLLAAARRSDVPARMKAALRWLALGMLMQATGGAHILGELLLHPYVHSVRMRQLLFGLSYPCTMIGLILLPGEGGRRRQRGRALVQGATFLAGAGVPIWFFALAPQLAHASAATFLYIVIMPAGALIAMLVANWAVETRPVFPTRAAFQFLLTGLVFLWLSDLVLSIDHATGIIRGGTLRWVNAVNGAGFCLMLLGAWHVRHDAVAPGPRRPLVEFSPLPLATIVVEVGFISLIVTLGQPQPGALLRLLIGLAVFLAMLLIRETFIIRDSLRLMSSEARQQEQARFEALVRHSSDLIMVVDHDRRIRFASPAARAMLGQAADALSGRALLEIVHPEDRKRGEGFLGELAASPAGTRLLRWRLADGTGAYRDFETAGSNRLADEAIAGIVLNSRDISERTALEERLARGQKMEAVGRLAGGVAHDFNNLLTIFLTDAELALGLLDGEHPARPLVQDILQAAKRGAALTTRMLAFSHPDRFKPRTVSAPELVQEAAPMLESMLGGRARLVTRIDPRAGGVKVNSDEFIHALINLGANARDAMPEGGTLTVAVFPAEPGERPGHAYLDTTDGPHVVVEVSDTGSGMDEATRMRAFEPFFTTKDRSKGTGLGLASVYGMVKAANGGISLRTARGAGTTIQLWLPAVPLAPAAGGSAASPAPAGSAPTGTILLVEDEAALRLASTRILERAGYRVLAAGESGEAVKVFASHREDIDLLLADVVMPGLSGPRLATHLLRERPQLKVLLTSGFTDHHLAAESELPEGTQFIPKPFSGEQLVARVRLVMGAPRPG
ncbi:MAG TPA: response regulator [Opitutaceae bacterium]|nr:response regulator [Opitutaceae bacterium]